MDFMTPVWLIPIFAFILMLDRIEKFKNRKPRNLLYLGKAVIDLYFILIYSLISFDSYVFPAEKSEMIGLGVLLLFSVNAIYVILEHLPERLEKHYKNLFDAQKEVKK